MESGTAHTGRKRINPGRSKFGCFTCRSKHVKCDEQLPVCRRCERLGLTCQPYWSKATPSPKPPRTLKQLRAKGSPCRASRSPSDIYLAHSPASLNSVAETWLDQVQLAQMADPPETPEMLNFDVLANVSGSISQASQSQPNSVTPGGTIDSLEWIPQNSSPLSTSHIPLPSSLILGEEELDALRHYETSFALSQTAKDPKWSFPKLLLRQSSHSTMAMHFALAISLHDLDTQYDTQTNRRLLAHHHFNSGSSMFKHDVSDSKDHVEILSCLYYIYIYMSRQRLVDEFKLQKLSRNTLDYIDKLELESLARSGLTEQLNRVAPNAAIRSFLCRLILWLYKEDVYCSFSGCAGDVARYFQGKPNLLKAVWEVSRPMLQLNWGAAYPESQCINDMEMSHVVDMTIDLLSLRFDVTEMGHSRFNLPTLQMIEDKFSLIETKYSIVFGIATSPTAPSTGLVAFAAAAVAIYHAIRLCCYRYTEHAPEKIRTIPAEQCLSQLLAAAQRATSSAHSTSMFDGLQWALFIGGIETKDTIHRDWIMSKLNLSRFKSALQTIIEVESQFGRVGMQTISTILRGSYTGPISTTS
ncbi:hypothetical protein BKA56DRAFT_574369 [Ilyonectria sp. MPI-CAGE-AT-0026]|nr:hypothetical protein BKA56DRAFT_574369 [Ilyonectria sp. MPI-CAGE-AT-0026]